MRKCLLLGQFVHRDRRVGLSSLELFGDAGVGKTADYSLPIRVLCMRETTAEIWIGPAQGSEWMGTQGGLNATHLLLLRENSRPTWMLMPGNLYESKLPELGRPKVWVPSYPHPLEDALLLFAVMGAKVPEVRAVLGEFEKSRNRSRLDVDELFPKGFPRQVYAASQKHLKGWHVVVSMGDSSHAKKDLSALKRYKGLDIEVRRTTSFQRSFNKD